LYAVFSTSRATYRRRGSPMPPLKALISLGVSISKKRINYSSGELSSRAPTISPSSLEGDRVMTNKRCSSGSTLSLALLLMLCAAIFSPSTVAHEDPSFAGMSVSGPSVDIVYFNIIETATTARESGFSANTTRIIKHCINCRTGETTDFSGKTISFFTSTGFVSQSWIGSTQRRILPFSLIGVEYKF
jgi:hypothetical protein